MHVALCHDAVIPPKAYGGTERVIDWLARALVKQGHRVTLIAREGSGIPGVPTVPTEKGKTWDELAPGDVELLHLWATPGTPPRKPFVVTIEGNGNAGEKFHANTLFVSRKHAENHGSTHFVYNGLPIEEFHCDRERDDYLVFLAKASWKVKNLDGAVAIARAAGMRLEVLGSRDWPLGLQRLLPPIGGVRYRGMVGDTEKRALLRRASGLLFPVLWHEPFGIAITEALASGCPVFGTPYGSLPEIVTPEVGKLSASSSELVQAIRDRGRFKPEVCRARVTQGFTDVDMAKKYLGYYESVLKTGQLAPGPQPRVETRRDFVAQNLLPWS